MKEIPLLPRKPRSRAELARLAASIGASHFARPALVAVSIEHDDDCPMLAGAAFCRCDVEFRFEEIRS